MKQETMRPSAVKRFIYAALNNYLIVVGMLVFVVITSILEPNFLTAANVGNLLRQFGPLAFVSLGMTFVIQAGYIDLSLAGIISMVSVIGMDMINKHGAVTGIVIALVVGLLAGMFNAIVLLFFGIQNSAGALFVTYGLSLCYGALALTYTNGATLQLTNSDARSLVTLIGTGAIGVVPISFLLFAAVTALLHFYQRKTYMGRTILYTGGNPVAANLSGVPVKRSVFLIYTLCGLLAAVGAVVLTCRVISAGPKQGTGYDTNAIMAVVIGGTSLQGGNGSVLRTTLGVALVTLMSNCLNLIGVSSFMQDVVTGMIMIAAIWLDNRSGQFGGAKS